MKYSVLCILCILFLFFPNITQATILTVEVDGKTMSFDISRDEETVISEFVVSDDIFVSDVFESVVSEITELEGYELAIRESVKDNKSCSWFVLRTNGVKLLDDLVVLQTDNTFGSVRELETAIKNSPNLQTLEGEYLGNIQASLAREQNGSDRSQEEGVRQILLENYNRSVVENRTLEQYNDFFERDLRNLERTMTNDCRIALANYDPNEIQDEEISTEDEVIVGQEINDENAELIARLDFIEQNRPGYLQSILPRIIQIQNSERYSQYRDELRRVIQYIETL